MKNQSSFAITILRAVLLSCLCTCSMGKFVFAQGEANWWYFGFNAGLDFNGGVPVAVTNGQLYTDEGCASISDAIGNLLFYTDGITVWNRNHVQMPNGFGLMGHKSSTHSAVIIQKPGNATIYYIFTADAQTYANGIRYNEIDMTLNAGLGDVTANKNILLYTPSCEKITAVKHCNSTDVWVVTHEWNSDAFRTYLVTAAGVNTIPVVSNAGLVVSGNDWNAIGQLKSSPDGRKLASAITSPTNRFELFDFDNSTGIVSNAILFPQFPIIPNGGTYGVEFSPDGIKMYGNTMWPGNIYQFDLCAGSNTAIANSGVLIGTASNVGGGLQLGPDKKIYIPRDTSWLGVVNSPNILGTGCNYVNIGVSLAGKKSRLGLPNFASYYFKQAPPPFTVSVNCLTGTFTAPTVNITNCSGSTNAITSVSWNFGDPASGANNTSTITNPTHAFTNAGTYTVTLVLNYACGNDTIQQNVTVASCGTTVTTTPANISCNGQCTGVATANPANGTSPYTYNWSNSQTTQTITGLCAGTYSVFVTDASGATAAANVTITQPTALTTSTTATPAACGNNNGSATVSASGGTPSFTYFWNNGQTVSTTTGLSAGSYSVTVTDANNCTQTATVAVTQITGPTVSTSSTPQTCTQGGTATATASGGTAPYTYQWCNGQIVSTATGLLAGSCTVIVTDANNCSTINTVTIASSGNIPVVNTTVFPTSCTTNNGVVTASVSGGTAPYTYQWCNGQTVSTATGLSAGTCTVIVTDANGCSATANATVNMNAGPAVSINGNTLLCTGDITTLTASGGATYSWNTSATTTSISLTLTSTSTFTVIATDTSGCSGTASIIVTVSPPPIAAISGTDTICEGDNAFLTASGGGNYSWNTGATTSSITSTLTSTSTFTVIVSIGSCSDTAFHTLNVLPNPIANAGVNITITQGQSTTLTANGGGTYSWSNGGTSANISVSPTITTFYCVTVTDANNCQDTACVTVFVKVEPIDCASAGELYLPNAFSPNGDGENDVLKIYYGDIRCIETFKLVIYNRWGEKVFSAAHPSETWNGTYKGRGKPENTAVFVYYLKVTFTNGEKISRKGNISLIR